MKATERPMTLGDLLRINKGQVYDSSLAGEDGPVLLGMGIFSPDGGFRTHKLRRYSGQVRPEGKVSPGTVVVATTDMGANIKILGRSATVPASVGDFAIATGDLGVVRWQTEDATLRAYAYWVMRTEAFRNYCLRFARGTAVRRIHPSDIETFPIAGTRSWHVPHLLEALQAIDDKIELNRRMNATLEAMAQALFQSWFVDFDPVRAKLDGRRPAGVEPETAVLFPGTFQDSPLGSIPKGWPVARLDDIASITMGLSPDGESYNAEGAGIPLINGPVEFGDYFPVKAKWTQAATRFAAEGDLIFCVRGSTTGRRVISDGEYGIGRGVCAIRAKGGFHSFLYQTINAGLGRLLEKTTGSVFPSLSAPDIKSFTVLKPSEEVLDLYERNTKPLIRRIQQNQQQSRTLATLRDTLLPRLLSGELAVNCE